jgi:oligoendopeptidase F
MFGQPPRDAKTLTEWTWQEIEPFYLNLTGRSVTTETVSEFLADWTLLSESLDEAFSRLYVATTVNTADAEAEKRYHSFLETVYPRAEEAEQTLKRKLIDQGLTPPGFEVPLRKMRTEADIFREANLTLLVEHHKLSTRYDKIMGGQTVNWEGRELTIAQMRPFFQNPDRDLRERAWRLATGRQMEDREAIDSLWQESLAVRFKLASNADFPDYRSFRWKQMLRFDYSPEDCRRFHVAIEKSVVPAAARVCERRCRLLGVERLRPWDLDVDPLGRTPLAPFQDVERLLAGASAIFHRVDPVLGGHFDTMIDERLLDLENRKNKAPGGYCTEFPAARRPFIFMNAVGLHDDVQTLLHESGHAFHSFERNALPYYQQRQVGMEFSEVASMAMELLASPYLAVGEGGFYSETDAARAMVEHLEKNILFWPFMAVVDAFQHWVYENPGESVDPAKCDAQWARTWKRFMPWIDWTGLETELNTGWQRKLHIHTVPFYYVEYGLALLGAVQVWANALKDQNSAVAAYRKALALGGTVPLPQLFAAAGAKFAFDADTLGSAVTLMERIADDLAGRS